ncbi:hypothetical protein [Agrococcus sp. SGAir0287]|uniref:hypothetical protein n=1 Tax=Agrococcus sp. SGAir0287 TaxID=2070347 RepID=UPI0010CD685F|nr:hypothetical protein [Agrococcus sp. SGAir0287]QCR20091.1 hypothetical protein C1N71_12110 [Agrococcus sp. SGAir0287]
MRLELPLPGRWYALPIGAPDARTRIRRFAEEVHGAGDDRALDRIRLRRRLHLALAHAERGRAQQLHLGRALDGGLPLPASIAVYPGIAVGTAVDASPEAVMDALVPLVLRAAHEPLGGSPIPGPDDRVLRTPRSLVLRRPTLEHVEAEAVGRLPTLRVDYWVTVPGERHAMLVHAVAPETALAPLLRELFDEIIVGARFASDSALAAELRR